MGEDKPTFATVAEAIASGTAHEIEGICKALEGASPMVKPNRELPKHAELRKRVERVQEAAEEMDRALKDFPIHLFSLSDFEGYFLDQAALEAPLESIWARAESTLANIPKAGPLIDTRRDTCAMIIIACWKLVHGASPGSTNFKVQQIIDDYWVACGGTPAPANGAVERWRRRMERVLALPQTGPHVVDTDDGLVLLPRA
jgi:hypothetical protein